MSANEDAKRKAAGGLEVMKCSPSACHNLHGADVYQTDMILLPSDGGWTANAEVLTSVTPTDGSTFGKIAGTLEKPGVRLRRRLPARVV